MQDIPILILFVLFYMLIAVLIMTFIYDKKLLCLKNEIAKILNELGNTNKAGVLREGEENARLKKDSSNC